MRMLRAMLLSELVSPQAPSGAFSPSPFLLYPEAAGSSHAGASRGAAAAFGKPEGGAGAGGQGGDPSLHDRAFYGQMPFLEGGFGDGFDLGGSGWREGVDPARAPEGKVGGAGATAADGEGRGASGGVSGVTVAAGIDAAVMCLQECQSQELQRGLLEVLLGLRVEKPSLLRRQLLR